MNMKFYDVNKGIEENGRLVLNLKLVFCFRREGEFELGYK